MMELLEEELRLIDLFQQKAADRRRELQMRALEHMDEERKQHHERRIRKEAEERRLEQLLETTAQIVAFNDHLDGYDTATVHALMDNQNSMDLVLRQRDEIEASAYRLPDARMAFKTEDGKRVFDRQGTELSRETVHPDLIPDSAPRWEAIKANVQTEHNLMRERDELHLYQHRLDEAREASGKDNVTADVLTKMDADLRQAMPNAVKARLPGAMVEQDVSSPQSAPPPMSELSKPRLQVPAPAGP